MKRLATAAALCCTLLSTYAKQPTVEQVEQYLGVTKTKEVVDAQVEGFSKQYATASSPKQMEQINRYLNSVMGWSAVKDEYIKLVQETYTAEEIQASLKFMQSAMGQSIARKNLLFSNKTSTLVAKRAQSFIQGSAAKSEQAPDQDEAPTATDTLEVLEGERHHESERTYFTGKVVNRGKTVVRGAQVEVNLFMGGKFVDQYNAYISGAIPAGGERYFKVSCGCKDAPPAQHDSFRFSVVSTY